ncbi:MAG: ATP-dependent zinc metalloprotease FtsH [Lachnospirales bacterium]
MSRNKNGYFLYIIVLVGIIMILLLTQGGNSQGNTEPYYYNNLIYDLAKNEIKKIEFSVDSEIQSAGIAKVYFNDNLTDYKTVVIPDVNSFMEKAHSYLRPDKIVEFDTLPLDKTSSFFRLLFPIILVFVMMFVIMMIMQQANGGAGGGGANKAMSFGKNKAKLVAPGKNKTKFDNVAGLIEEKVELVEVVDFLKNPEKYLELGARIPKGLLLVGPPGTGKTLLAKAVAGEANAPFFSISGSDFVEMFVGVGASRVRDLFAEAKKTAPCLIFIDEIDAVGRRRGAGLGGGHDEREQTLNQLLVEMDGFDVNEGIIILAATNRADILDPALLRPGRFDRQISVGPPDVKGREEILGVHIQNKKVAEDINLKTIAQITAGFTGADLENLLNEAAIISAREDKKEIDMEAIRKAFIKLGIGSEKKSRVVSLKEKRITAYHEAGHAILFEVLDNLDPVHIVSIIPTGFAGGYTMPLPSEDKNYHTKTFMIETIMSLLGGRVAEKIMLDEITSGASNDIERATNIARRMVTKLGMSDSIGPIQLGSDDHEVFLGKDISNARNYGENIATEIDIEIKNIIHKAYNDVEIILRKYINVLEKSCELLMEKEKISGKEFRELFPEGTLKPKENIEQFKEILIDNEIDNIL